MLIIVKGGKELRKVLFTLLLVTLVLTACVKDSKVSTSNTPTTAPTTTPMPTREMNKEEIIPAKPFDEMGRAIAMYGTPSIDGNIDEVWNTAGIIIPNLKSLESVQATGEFRVLWDDDSLYTLYVVKDPDLNKSNMNSYEQDSVEIFLDEANDKSLSYQSDDLHYRVNYDNTPSTDAGDPNRFSSATSLQKDDSGKIIGYIVETSVTFMTPPKNDTIMGFELQINDANSQGIRIGTINIFDKTGTAWQNPSTMGEIIYKGKSAEIPSNANFGMLKIYYRFVELLNPKGYVNSDTLIEPMKNAKAILDNPASTQEQIDIAEAALRKVVSELNDGSGFVSVNQLVENSSLTDPFTFFSGDTIKSVADWNRRADEIASLYHYYMYGVMPDKAKEKIGYNINGNEMSITVELEDKKVSFPVTVSLPDKKKVPMPKDGYPVLIAFGWLTQTAYANDNGYAVIILNTELIAADNSSRKGVFYDLYPYGDVWTEQTGALMAWSWGVSKILDALEVGASKALTIDPEHSIITGVSRWGKAAAVAGAFDKRIKVTAPSCSGSGGMASFRYKSEGKTYDYSSIGLNDPYKMTTNEPLSSLQSSNERHWFNDNFLNFKNVNALPFDQHLLASLCADNNRYLFITGSYLYEDWTNPPGMWLTYLAAKEVYDYLGLKDHIAIHIHKEGHMVTDEDMVYLLDFCNYHFYGKKVKSNLNDLTTSLYEEEANYDTFYRTFNENWKN